MKTAPRKALVVELALVFAGAVILSNQTIVAAPGDLDLTFGGTGMVTTDFGGGDAVARGVVLQNDGKVVVGGTLASGVNAVFALARFNIDGSLDTSFNGTGKVTTDFGGRSIANSVALQGDGKIVLAGYFDNGGPNTDFAVARFDIDGSLDTSFNATGRVKIDVSGGFGDQGRAVSVQSDGKIVIAGYSDIGNPNTRFALARLNIDGSLDTGFSGDGKLTLQVSNYSEISSMALQSNGKVVVAGRAYNGSDPAMFAVARFTSDGSLDTGFSGDGKVTTPVANSSSNGASGVVVQNDGNILAVGDSHGVGPYDFALERYDSSGNLDTSFAGTGKLTTDFDSGGENAYAVALQSDGRIVVAGSSGSNTYFALARYNSDGGLDTSFSGDGKLTTDFGQGPDNAYCLAIQNDGKIIAAGNSGVSFAVARYEGVPEPTVAVSLLLGFGALAARRHRRAHASDRSRPTTAVRAAIAAGAQR